MRSRLVVLASFVPFTPLAVAHDVNGYAVGNHRACGASNLPGTIAELDKFFASPYFPEDARKNFQWNDARVRAAEWARATDVFASAETANGFDGADSALVSYIASHGVTSSGKYTALAGGANSACYIRTPDLSLGDQSARYLILSTCQGLKIGTGDDPTRVGENPQVTWANANQGLNCIFGYSNNMVDADTYGDYLLEALATSDDTLAEAFFRTARRVSFANIPAAMCFGPDDQTAKTNLETARRFTEDRYGRGGSAWAYDSGRRLDAAFVLPQGISGAVVPRVLKTRARVLPVAKLARALVGDAARAAGTGSGLKVYRQAAATLTYDPRTNLVAWRRGTTSLARASAVKDATAVRIARNFLAAHGVVRAPESELAPTYVFERGALVQGKATVVAKTVIFHQRLHGLAPLRAAGSVEVTIDAAGQVTALTAALVDAAQLRISEWVDLSTKSIANHKDYAVRRLMARLPGANVAVLDARVGYETGDYAALQERSRLTVEVLLEAERGGFTRRYVERMPL